MEEREIKFYGLSWVIELHFKSMEEAKLFSERENLDIEINPIGNKKRVGVVCRIEE